MIILAIETSCDETSVAVMKDDYVLTNIISSQIEDHLIFGGVVPELASRLHLKNLTYVLSLAIKKSAVNINEIDYIAYTSTPGLIGALHIGKIAAQTLGMWLKKPVLAINHLEGHIYSGAIDNTFVYPLVALLVSGGHTQLVFVKNALDFKIIGTTLDDAVGECYDKVARVLGLNYPGGPEIDRLAKQGEKGKYHFSLPLNDHSYNFSFSGLKSAAVNLVNKLTLPQINIANFCSDFQSVVITILLKKLQLAINEYHPKMIVLAGGVSANTLLRTEILKLTSKKMQVVIPKLEYCTDNAAMIAKVAMEKIKKNKEGKR